MAMSVTPATEPWLSDRTAANEHTVAMAQNDEQAQAITALTSYVSDMELKGYVGTSLKNNIQYWQLHALEDNPNIILQIKAAQQNSNSLDAVLGTDYYNVDSYYDINVAERNGARSLAWRLKSMPAQFGDRDHYFANDATAVRDWTGAEELWVKVDASEIPSSVGVRIAFEENAVGRQSFSLADKAAVRLIPLSGEEEQASADQGGFVTLPTGFSGYLALPLNAQAFTCYFEAGGNGVLDISNVVQFQLAVRGNAQMVGKTFYFDEFGVVGAVNGTALPAGSGTEGTYKAIWDLESVGERTGYSSSTLAWYGEFAGKLLTGMAYSYKACPSTALYGAAEELVEALSEAQGEDGYLGTYVGGGRFSIAMSNWDLWNHYHAITGLLEWYKISGNEEALRVARKAADCIYETFKDRSYLVVGGFETNRGIAHGYAQLYQVTGEKKYLDEAERIILQDCQDDNGWYKVALRGGHFYQSSSNRWEVLHMVMTLGILYEETGKQEYYDVMSLVWEDVLDTGIHNGGGFTTNEGAQGSPYMEGVIETCCTIAWLAMTNEYYKYNKSVAVADEFERSYYNALLGSLLDTDKYCTYNTPMDGVQGTCGHYDGRRVSSQQDISFQYNNGSPDMNCCQANLARGLGQIAEWAAVTDGSALYLNYYGQSRITTEVGGKTVSIRQTTTYPVDGRVTLTVEGLTEPTAFALKLRIPAWAYGSTAVVDGVRTRVQEGEYFTLDREWANGDAVTLDLELPVMFWRGMEAQAAFTSVYRGPVLLTLDQAYATGLTQSVLFDVYAFENASFTAGTARGCMLFCDVQVGGETVRLVDFASAGKYNGNSQPSTYWSWLTVNEAPGFSTDAHTRWQNSDKIKVAFDDGVVMERAAYYVGETARFTVDVPTGKELVSVEAEGVTLTQEEGAYTFRMPDTAVEIKLTLRDVTGSVTPAPSQRGCGGAIGGGMGALVAMLGAGTLLARKKRSRK